MNITLDLITIDPANARRVPAGKVADEALMRSMDAIGLLQPITVRTTPTGFQVRYGHRRLAEARTLGWVSIEALVDDRAVDSLTCEQSAENIVRAPMHEIDQWRAMTRMVEGGASARDAGEALGIGERRAARWSLLGRIHPPALDWIIEKGEAMPAVQTLRSIAAAPLHIQSAAWESASKENWPLTQLANLCNRQAIPRSRAIFDTDKCDVVFEEDLFAEPGSDEQFVTHDIAGFLLAQKGTLADKVNQSKKRGGKVTMIDIPGPDAVALPPGWVRSYDHQADKRLRKGDPGMIFTGVVERGYKVGDVVRCYGVQKAEKPAKAASVAAQGENASHHDDYSKRALELIAERKDHALRNHLRLMGSQMHARDLLTAMMLAISGANVTISGVDHPNGYRGRFGDLLPRLFNEDGRVVPDNIEAVAAEALARMLRCPSPNTYTSSGAAAEWVGSFLEAPAPRLDDAEALAVISGGVLSGVAREKAVSVPKAVGAMRTALVGKLPDWTPPPALFSAPPPSVQPLDPEEDEPDEDEPDEQIREAFAHAAA